MVRSVQPFVSHRGLVVPLDRASVDTDQIIPKQFLKRIERTGFGQYLFFDWRFEPDGAARADFILNQPRYRGATILLAGADFGCGSSREHAPWALADYGFRVVIAPSFADIFYNNSLKNGLLPIRLAEPVVRDLFRRAGQAESYWLTADLQRCVVEDDQGLCAAFAMDPFWRDCLLRGLDEIGLTLQHEDKIAAYEAAHAAS